MTTVDNHQNGLGPLPRAGGPGPCTSDADLLAWRQAAATGKLPVPTRQRWQQLRGGVVNMWEFDVEEYWCADGRAQFVGGNETGKSTLMTLTTLIMLDGSLDRSNIDTFGQQHKAFRYFLEPTDGPKDRRDTSAQTNRGWTWVEYGRLEDGVPRYFTTLLYGQTKRGVADVTRTWITCAGEARVRDGITLVRGQSVLAPADLTDVPGLKPYRGGTEYKHAVSAKLFGFTEPERMDSTIGMLKVLRTPQLGQRLDPTWFTDQMRRALPGIDESEINELAEGWDQLDRLARDRDSATEARNAVNAYLHKAWNPWADAVLRRAADDLAAATTEFDNVTRRYREAENALGKAQKHLVGRQDEHASAKLRWEDLSGEYDSLIGSRPYRDAQAATDRVQQLAQRAEETQSRADDLREELSQAEKAARRSAGDLEKAENETETARSNHAEAVRRCVDAFDEAGVPTAQAWTTAGDIDRLATAADQRRGQVAQLRGLTRAAETAGDKHRHAEERHTEAAQRRSERQQQADEADAAVEQCLQFLSDTIEAWVADLPELAPEARLREQWVHAVTDQAASPNPRTVLRSRITADWLAVVTVPLTREAGAARDRARTTTEQALELEQRADARESETDPTPTSPPGWLRRDRPASDKGAGAPLWRLLDPVDSVEDSTLAMVEAALAGAGLLDAWVAPDRVWVADRDGDDAVLTLAALEPTTTGATLARVLTPAADAGPMTGQVLDLLARIAYAPSGAELHDAYSMSADGRWRTPVTSGRARPEHEGPSLLGAAARAAARTREVAALREQAAQLHAKATDLTRQAEALEARVAALHNADQSAPTDDDTVAAARAAATAAGELERATHEAERAEQKAREAETVANDARAAQLNYAGDHSLPTDSVTLDDVAAAVDRASSRTQELRTELREVYSAEQIGRAHV